VARPSAYIVAVTGALRAAGFAVDETLPPLSLDEAARHNAIFLDGAEGEESTLRTLAMLREMKEPNAAPFVGILGVPPDDKVAALYAAAGAQTCLPPDERECTMRLRYIANAVSVRASLNDALRELRQSEERWRLAVGALDEGLLVQTHDGTVTTTNAAARRILGMTEEEMRGRAWRSPEFIVRTVDGRHVGPDDLPGARALREKRPILGVVLGVTTPRGHTAWASISSHPILDAAGDASGVVVTTLRDLTDQRRLEMHVMATERLTSLGRLAASVGHEINNPLTYVLSGVGYVQQQLLALPEASLAAWRASGGDPGEVLAALEDAVEGAQRVRDLVADLRSLANAPHDAEARADLAVALDRACKVARHALQPGTTVAVELPSPVQVPAARAELVQLFACLLVNAAQASGAGPNCIRVTAEPRGAQVVVRVSDTGQGISPENLARILDPFFTTRAVGQGKGLGLKVAQGIAQGLGGGLQVESAPGQGTTVLVTLPTE